jgi:hypothetical protein
MSVTTHHLGVHIIYYIIYMYDRNYIETKYFD